MPEKQEFEAVRSRQELLGMLPYLLGFHPADSVVAVFLDAHSKVQVAGRMDMSAPVAEVVHRFVAAGANTGSVSVMLIGYGPRDAAARVGLVVDALAARLPVTVQLLVTDGMFFCLGCPCPDVQGTAFDPAASAVAARSVVAGKVALPSRRDLVALTAEDPAGRLAVDTALRVLPAEADPPGAVLHYLMDWAADGHRLTAGAVARLLRLLTDPRIRETALEATGTQMWQRDLWLDLTRRAPQELVAGPACLAAWCAWQRGEQVIAEAAVQRALAVAPGDRFARLLDLAMRAALPPNRLLTALDRSRPHSPGGRP